MIICSYALPFFFYAVTIYSFNIEELEFSDDMFCTLYKRKDYISAIAGTIFPLAILSYNILMSFRSIAYLS
jgi:hypothetical protein